MDKFPQNIICETSIVSDGNMSFVGGGKGTVIHNRVAFLRRIGVGGERYCAIRCSHTDTVALVEEQNFHTLGSGPDSGIKAEAVVTRLKDVPLFLLTADCIPLSLFDPQTETIALAHVSRVTLEQGLVGKTIEKMRQWCGVLPEDLRIFIGPHIHKDSYRFALPLSYKSEMLTPFIEEKDGYAHIDLQSACIHALTHAGVKKKNMQTSPIDTAASSNHFSYYCAKSENGDTNARIATVLMLR